MPDQQNSLLRCQEASSADVLQIARTGKLFAIVDSARIPVAAKWAWDLGDQNAISLYRETPEQEFWDIAPYLFTVTEALLEWLFKIAATDGWGTFVASRADLLSLRHHFRHFLKVQAPRGETWVFRFYDPRVLRPFLISCSAEELRLFFGPVQAYGIFSSPESVVFYQEAAIHQPMPLPKYALMFKLRDAHIEALSTQADRALATEVIGFLRSRFPQLVVDLPPETLERRVLLGFNRARTYGFTRTSTLAAFVGIMFELGPLFDEHPVIQSALREGAVPPDDRWNLMFVRASEADWESARQLSGQSAWQELLAGAK